MLHFVLVGFSKIHLKTAESLTSVKEKKTLSHTLMGLYIFSASSSSFDILWPWSTMPNKPNCQSNNENFTSASLAIESAQTCSILLAQMKGVCVQGEECVRSEIEI